ncbi:hypothetical protein [Streptomyces sp. SID2119]|uniref:hypothetical protein n=1 Tax=Streptomyces sp. SID2119 TaxID=2690253 RepID=UPI00136E09F2|nr:hypothetical protein [Streptomyces sp. SID2119]MYW28330.1 hypothetical protein [Streptomyces sp. SID2119]
MKDWYIHDRVESVRFFWYPGRRIDRWPLLRLGNEENCNKVLSIRIPGGALNICLNTPLRQKPCAPCLAEERAWVWDRPARRMKEES